MRRDSLALPMVTMNLLNTPEGYDWENSLSFQHIYPSQVNGPDNPPAIKPAVQQFASNPSHDALTNDFISGLQLPDQNNTESLSDPMSSNSTTRRETPSGSINAVPRGVSRRSKYRNLNWNEHKSEIKKLYLDEDKTLHDTMEIMKERYSFDAPKKLYKENFKQWKWQKNLPSEHAQFMVTKANKRKREDGKDTIYHFGGLRWTKQRAEASASRKGKVSNSQVIYADTPEEITYETPNPHQDSTIGTGVSPEDASGTNIPEGTTADLKGFAEDESGTEEDEDVEIQPLSHSSNNFSKMNLLALFQQVEQSQRNGDPDTTEKTFKKLLEGCQNIIGPLHPDTNKAAYALATFYAEHNRLAEANGVLEGMSRAHMEEYGAGDLRTQQHILHVDELLHTWNRSTDVLAFLIREKHLGDTSPNHDDVPRRKKHKNGRRHKDSQHEDRAQSNQEQLVCPVRDDSIDDQDHTTIGLGLEVFETARVSLLTRDKEVETLLLEIISQCEVGIKTLKDKLLSF